MEELCKAILGKELLYFHHDGDLETYPAFVAAADPAIGVSVKPLFPEDPRFDKSIQWSDYLYCYDLSRAKDRYLGLIKLRARLEYLNELPDGGETCFKKIVGGAVDYERAGTTACPFK